VEPYHLEFHNTVRTGFALKFPNLISNKDND
jgi:hypothetical protein